MGDLTNLTVGEEQFSIGQTLPSTATVGQIMRYFNGKWSPVTFGVVPSGGARAGLVLDNYGAPNNGNFNFGINAPGGVVGGTYLNQSFSLAGQNKIKELATAAPLTGLNTSQGGVVTANDTVLSAIGKLQANSGGGSGMIEGEYTIPEIYYSSTSGQKPTSGETVVGTNANVWYQKTGKYLRAVIVFIVANGASASTYNTVGFNRADLFGDGKLFPENSEPVFTKFSGGSVSSSSVTTGTAFNAEPLLWLVESMRAGASDYNDLVVVGITKLSGFPSYSVGQKNFMIIEAVCLM